MELRIFRSEAVVQKYDGGGSMNRNKVGRYSLVTAYRRGIRSARTPTARHQDALCEPTRARHTCRRASGKIPLRSETSLVVACLIRHYQSINKVQRLPVPKLTFFISIVNP